MPRFTSVAVVEIPELVVSMLCNDPHVPAVFNAVPFATPAIVKVKVGSTFTFTRTDSTVPIFSFVLSRSTLFVTSLVVTVTVHVLPYQLPRFLSD